MSAQTYTAPRTRSIILGIAAFLVLVMLILSLGDLTKWVGAAFMFIPARLGLIQQVTAADVIPVDLSTNPTRVEITRPGLYALYAGDRSLLEMALDAESKRGQPWANIKFIPGGEKVPVSFVARGLTLYDTPLAKGRPVFSVTIKSAGTYEIQHPVRPVIIAIVPDLTSGNECTLGAFFIIQLAIIAYFPIRSYRRRRRAQQANLREIDSLKQIRGEDFWKNQFLKKGSGKKR
jgi:hypothetical protein